MAKRRNTVNKAQAIRDYLATNPSAKGVEVVAALSKKGIAVAPAQVSNIRTAGKKKRKVRVGAMSKGGSDGVGIKQILDAAYVMLDRLSVEDASDLLERLAGGRRKAK